ncbi:MAG: hypothetical protein JSS95_08320 [Acidobacteria bacterium]|nr:hypothetical protein [Acidobacteriota bacterium]
MRSRLVSVILYAVFVPIACFAQQHAVNSAAPAPSLHEILIRLQQNLWDYESNVPNFFAEEHVVSVLQQEGARDIKTTTDSIFRLRRSAAAIGEPHTLTETREIKTVNKKAAKGSDIQGPAIFTGAFSTGLSVVSLEMSRCLDYTLEPSGELNHAPAIVISYVIKPDMLGDESCPGPEKQSGRAWFDPAGLHVLRIEMAIPNHKDNHDVRTFWTWSVDYAPVTFDFRQFWMPKTITSKAVANSDPIVWSFTATYSNYHKLTVSSHIITDVGDSPPPQ